MVLRPDGHREGREMFKVYILKSLRTDRYYIGSTNDLERRLAEHNSGKTRSLLGHLPVALVFSKDFASRKDALRIEKLLKAKKSRVIIDRIVQENKIRGL